MHYGKVECFVDMLVCEVTAELYISEFFDVFFLLFFVFGVVVLKSLLVEEFDDNIRVDSPLRWVVGV